MALLLVAVFSLSITPSASQTVQCFGHGSHTGGACQGTSFSNLKAVSGHTIYCEDGRSCQYANLTATSTVWVNGRFATYGATIRGGDVYMQGLQNGFFSTIAATGFISLDSYQSTVRAKSITAPTVQIYGYLAAYLAEDITADTVDIKGYQGARGAKVTASKVDVTGERGGYDTDFYPKDGTLDITFNGYQAGYRSDILCEDTNCSIHCATHDSCYDVNFYCVGDGECTYNQQCGDDTGESEYCLKFYKEGVDGLTAVDIHELYEKNKARRPAPADEEPINDDPNQPDGPPDSPTNPINDYYFSLSTVQFVVLCGLIAVLFALSTASCIYTIKTSKNKGFRVMREKEDFQ